MIDSLKVVESLHGYPPCPMCNRMLFLRKMPDYGETYWYCKSCGTQWDTRDLIEALNQAEELVRVLTIRETYGRIL